MSDQLEFETRFSAAVKAFATNADGPIDAARIAASALTESKRSGWWRRLASIAQPRAVGQPARGNRLLVIALAATLAIGAFGLGVYWQRGVTVGPPVIGTETPSPMQSPTLAPSLITWSVVAAGRDWPGAPRLEQDEYPLVRSALSAEAMCALPPGVLSSVVLNGDERCSHGLFTADDPDSPENAYIDAVDESSLQSYRFIDIRAVGFREHCWFQPATCVLFDTVELVRRPLPHPQEQWIAFGLVADTNGDGRPDLRYGIDNAPAPRDGSLGPVGRQRMWRANLSTGEIDYYTHVFEVPSVMDAFFPGDRGDPAGPTAGSIYAHREGGSPFRFYVWASLIRYGQVVATDFAPDTGWLEAESGRSE